MGKPVMNIMRLMRIQLKSGYVKVEPESYTFMKRYPPLTRDSAKVIRRVEVTTIPYLRLYEDALARNPKYIDERVYPAYWQQEPVAMTLAKKQYELMKKGLTEEEAYEGALQYTETLESKAYEEMKKVIDMSGNADALKPLQNDPAFVKTMKVYSTILSEVDYDDLEDHDQGELDHMLQTKVLKWSEVERERRMKDPVFAIEFERLRKVMFPMQSKIGMERKPDERMDSMEILMDLYQVDETKLCTNEPFYYDDYMFLFEKAKNEPLLGRWNVRDRQELSRWITDTLAIREIVEKRETAVVQRYLDDLRAQFFPMVRYPDRAHSFTLPDIDEFRAILYANDVGYKRVDDKLFVQRIHKLPMLLFPKETFTTSLLTDRKRLMDVMENEGNMLAEVKNAGLELSEIDELKTQLAQYSGATGPRKASPANINMSALDKLVSQNDDEEYDDSDVESDSEKVKALKVKQEGDEEIDSEDEEDYPLSPEEIEANEVFYKFINGREKKDMPEGEWEKIVRQYYRQPTTELERVRESYRGSERERTMAARTELSLSTIKDEIEEGDMIVRARLSVRYEDKESARRGHVWEERGVWGDELPRPTLRLL